MKEQINELLKRVGLRAEDVKLETQTIGEGEATIEAESFEAGQPVNIVEGDQRVPLPIGEYKLDSGMALVVVEEGIIAEMKEANTEEEQPMQEEEAMSDKPTETPALPKKVVESVSKESYFSEANKMPQEVIEAITGVVEMALENKLTELGLIKKEEELKTEELSEEPKVELSEEVVKPIVHNPENKNEVKLTRYAKGRKASTLDRVLNRINNL